MRRRGAKLRLSALQRGLADVLFLGQLALAFVVPGGNVQRGARGLHLRLTGRTVLGGCAGIDAHQHLALGDCITRLYSQRDDRTLHLRGNDRLTQGLDHAIKGASVSGACALHGCAGQCAC